MKIAKEKLEKAFKDYYAKNGETATHIFVYSENQDNISIGFAMDAKQTYVNEVRYSEARSRDADLNFNFYDSIFISVGTYDDIKRH